MCLDADFLYAHYVVVPIEGMQVRVCVGVEPVSICARNSSQDLMCAGARPVCVAVSDRPAPAPPEQGQPPGVRQPRRTAGALTSVEVVIQMCDQPPSAGGDR